MAQRRMFSLTVVDTDKFLDMPCSTQLLYFQLGVRADDEGFVSSPKKITRLVGCNDDDLKVLAAKGFIIPFESGVCVITDWRQNNYLRSDRFNKTIYTDERKRLSVLSNGSYAICDRIVDNLDTTGIPSGNQAVDERYTQDSIGKDSIGKVSIGKVNIDYQQIADMYNNTCASFPRLSKLSDTRKKAIKARLNTYSLEDFKRVFELAEESDFLKGKNDRNWFANFDWLIKDSNMAKVLDGNYSSKPHERQEVRETKYDMDYIERAIEAAGGIQGEDTNDAFK